MHNSSVLPSTPASVNGMSPHCHLTFKQTHKHQVYSRFPCTHKTLLFIFFYLLNYTSLIRPAVFRIMQR